ncbi:hypothetical protein J4E83_001217 [Alternaria metachromatica]|uniref:uncharacterized protein n=1 Tax=Alternaria metachromatica TaxID=283354 RepID=UPI0020C32AA5|nr:uncharacterized protein J4E83_001217 [Alternaria metachromatica]XP_049245356.1 uncharacterized protein J4E84_003977 [Alternaria hordeiaustralica]KAI4636263.1 hypothetical protein J4E83_001217 [Alternaria metachromatica]KAI4689797.1 hypothetical protein J4E84_003977 [Alternaria hordeiaustralica]
MDNQSQTVQTWSLKTTIEEARTKPNFRSYVLSKSSGKTILALHPIAFDFLQESLVHQERAELASKIDADICSAKPKTKQAAVSFALEESIKRLCRLGVVKKVKKDVATNIEPSPPSQPKSAETSDVLDGKKTGAIGSPISVTNSKPSEPGQAMPVRTKVLDENKPSVNDTSTSVPRITAGPSKYSRSKSVEKSTLLEGNKVCHIGTQTSVTTIAAEPSKNRPPNTAQIEGRHGLRARGGPPTTTLEAFLYRYDTFTRLAKRAADPYHKTHMKGPKASHSRRVRFSPNVRYEEYDQDSPASTSDVATSAKPPCDTDHEADSSPKPLVLLSLYDVPEAPKSIPEEQLIRCVDEVMAQGAFGIDELDAQVLYIQRGIPYGDRAYQCAWVKEAQESLTQAYAAVDDACQNVYPDSRCLKRDPVMKAVVAIARAQRLLELALLRVNGPAYSKAYLTAYGRG